MLLILNAFIPQVLKLTLKKENSSIREKSATYTVKFNLNDTWLVIFPFLMLKSFKNCMQVLKITVNQSPALFMTNSFDIKMNKIVSLLSSENIFFIPFCQLTSNNSFVYVTNLYQADIIRYAYFYTLSNFLQHTFTFIIKILHSFICSY